MTLRVGCPHCGPRAGRCGTPPTGCFASGENDKKEAVRECILSAALFFVFIAPVGSLSASPNNMRKEVGNVSLLHRRTGAGLIALPWGYGGEKPPAPPFLTYPAERRLEKQTSATQKGCRADGPAAGGYGGRAVPCSAVPHLPCGKTSGKADFCNAERVQGRWPCTTVVCHDETFSISVCSRFRMRFSSREM